MEPSGKRGSSYAPPPKPKPATENAYAKPRFTGGYASLFKVQRVAPEPPKPARTKKPPKPVASAAGSVTAAASAAAASIAAAAKKLHPQWSVGRCVQIVHGKFTGTDRLSLCCNHFRLLLTARSADRLYVSVIFVSGEICIIFSPVTGAFVPVCIM